MKVPIGVVCAVSILTPKDRDNFLKFCKKNYVPKVEVIKMEVKK